MIIYWYLLGARCGANTWIVSLTLHNSPVRWVTFIHLLMHSFKCFSVPLRCHHAYVLLQTGKLRLRDDLPLPARLELALRAAFSESGKMHPFTGTQGSARGVLLQIPAMHCLPCHTNSLYQHRSHGVRSPYWTLSQSVLIEIDISGL